MQAHLAAWKGRPVGAIGDAGTFSFQASKNLNAGEGGIVLNKDDGWLSGYGSYHRRYYEARAGLGRHAG